MLRFFILQRYIQCSSLRMFYRAPCGRQANEVHGCVEARERRLLLVQHGAESGSLSVSRG